MAQVSCSSCGASQDADANFCSKCGSRVQPEAEPHEERTAAHSAVESIAAEPDGHEGNGRRGSIEVLRGRNAGSRYVLDAGTVRIGRHPESGIFLDDVTVSREHAQLTKSDEEFVLVDDGSLNGTYVNGVRIERAAINPGDQLQIGKYLLLFDVEDE